MHSESANLPVWATQEYAIYCHEDGERPYRVNARISAAVCDACGAWTNFFVPKHDLAIRD